MRNSITLLGLVLLIGGILLSSVFYTNKETLDGKPNIMYAKTEVPIFFSFGGEKIIKVLEFPDTEDFYNPHENRYVDAGIRYKQVTIFFLPIWNYDIEWCGYIDSDDTYIPLTYSELSEITDEVHLTLPYNPEESISDWNRFGGKIVLFVIFGLYLAARNE